MADRVGWAARLKARAPGKMQELSPAAPRSSQSAPLGAAYDAFLAQIAHPAYVVWGRVDLAAAPAGCPGSARFSERGGSLAPPPLGFDGRTIDEIVRDPASGPLLLCAFPREESHAVYLVEPQMEGDTSGVRALAARLADWPSRASAQRFIVATLQRAAEARVCYLPVGASEPSAVRAWPPLPPSVYGMTTLPALAGGYQLLVVVGPQGVRDAALVARFTSQPLEEGWPPAPPES